MRRIIKGARVILSDRIEDNTDVLIKDGKIEALMPHGESTLPDCEVIDAKGLFLSPGFVDIHLHGGGGASAVRSGCGRGSAPGDP